MEVDETKPSYETVKMFSDGGSRGNPGPSALGYAIFTLDDQLITSGGLYLGHGTNNQAEYKSLKMGLEESKKLGAKKVNVYMDSLLVVNQMLGKYRVKNTDLWAIFYSIKELLKQFEDVEFTHIPRELNKAADSEVNKALDNAIKH